MDAISTPISTPAPAQNRLLPLIVFSASMLFSASLLFVVEPMVGKMLMPMLGGSPAAWNTCLVFFQALLLAGYLYAHALLRLLSRTAQVVVQMLVVLSPLALVGLLPPHVPSGWEPPAVSNPTAWLLGLLFVVIGIPFFALSSNTSIMQRWYADSGRKDAHDPYFLYAASNAGSLVGLFSYPLLLEPLQSLHGQSLLWTVVYCIFVALTALCGVLAWRWRAGSAANSVQPQPAPGAIAWQTRGRWILLAFIPSSLMLGATSAITDDVPAIPLFWVLPLAAYLVSFVFVFARKPLISHAWLIERTPLLILAGLLPVLSQTYFSLPVHLTLYVAVLFGLSLLFHGELAHNRPGVGHLTDFYLCMSVGGVLGGIFNSLLAPVIFSTVLELPLILVAAAWLRPVAKASAPATPAVRRNDWLLPLALFACMALVILTLARLGIQPGNSQTILIFGYSLLWCLSFGKRRLRFGLGLVALCLASYFYAPFGQTLLAQRSFFGVYRVRNSPDQHFRYFFHGGILHGTQSLRPSQACEPLSYYTRSGPVGELFTAVQSRAPRGNWAVVGLGAGAMATYLQPGQSLALYEIDPLVAQIAADPHYFTYLSGCAPTTRMVLGDARLKLRDAPDGSYGLIALDAFSGDSIPMHLITREALTLYRRKLAPGGLIAFHISNRYFDLAPMLGNLAHDAHLTALIAYDTSLSAEQSEAGKMASTWMVMAATPDDLASLAADASRPFRWQTAPLAPGARLWTDDYSNLLGVMRPLAGK